MQDDVIYNSNHATALIIGRILSPSVHIQCPGFSEDSYFLHCICYNAVFWL